MAQNSILEQFQSAYQNDHSTETALLGVKNKFIFQILVVKKLTCYGKHLISECSALRTASSRIHALYKISFIYIIKPLSITATNE